LGGFHLRSVYGVGSAALARFAFGFRGAAGGIVATADLSAQVNIIALATHVTAANNTLYMLHNDGAGAATPVSTGLTCANGDIIQLDMQADSGGGDITWTVNVTTDAGVTTAATGTLSSNLPAGTTNLLPWGWAANGAAGGIGTLAFFYQGIDQPYGL
jgi:hypothetical protein